MNILYYNMTYDVFRRDKYTYPKIKWSASACVDGYTGDIFYILPLDDVI